MLAPRPLPLSGRKRFGDWSASPLRTATVFLELQMPDLSTVKDVATIGAPLIKMLVDTWLRPRFASLISSNRTDRVMIAHTLASKFEEYLHRSYDRQSYLRTIV